MTITGTSGDWTATHGPAEGWGRTRMEAASACLRELRSSEDDADRLDREDGVTRDQYGFAHRAE